MIVADLNDEEYVLRCFFEDENVRLRITDKMKEENFEDKADKQIVHLVNSFNRKHGRYPTAQELVTGLNQNPGYSEEAKEQLLKITKPIGVIAPDVKKKIIEDYFKFKVSQRLMEEYALHMHGKDPNAMRGIMPKLQDALNFKLSTNMGIHYIRDAKYAKSKLGDMEKSIPSKIGALRQFTSEAPESQGTCGGYFRKCLSVVGGTSGGGKSMFMVNEAAFASKLYTAGLPDVDLLIRTSGEMRTSNFLPWQLTYAEMVFDDCLWPDFDRTRYMKCLSVYASRDRRFGGVKGQMPSTDTPDKEDAT